MIVKITLDELIIYIYNIYDAYVIILYNMQYAYRPAGRKYCREDDARNLTKKKYISYYEWHEKIFFYIENISYNKAQVVKYFIN